MQTACYLQLQAIAQALWPGLQKLSHCRLLLGGAICTSVLPAGPSAAGPGGCLPSWDCTDQVPELAITL